MNRLLQIVLAILLPPVSVFLQRGLGGQFVLNVFLTLLFDIPGIIHALWLLLGEGSGPKRR